MIEIASEYKSVNDILLLFSFFPGKGLYRKEILENTGLSNIALDKSLMKMQNFGICYKEKRVIKINNNDKYIQNIISVFREEREKLNNPTYKEYRVIKETLRKILDEWLHYEFVILFGSRAKLVHREDSDYDIAIVSEKEIHQLQLTGKLTEVGRKFGVKIEPHFFSLSDFIEKKKKKNQLVLDIVKDGIFLLGDKRKVL